MKKVIFTQEETQKIIDLYNDNNTLKYIGEQFNVSRNVIKRVLEEQNIELRKTTHKHKCNYSIFETIDSSEKAYWLGFLAADGCNYRRDGNATIFINIHQKDREQLEKFRDFCNSDAKIEDYIQNVGFSNNTPMCKMSIYSIKMSDDLTDKGVPPKKSLILKPPKIDEQYYLPYICGLFDGDGSIALSNQNIYLMSIQGTKEILEWINSILHISENLEQRQETEKNTYYIRCGGTNKPYYILKQLYESCDTHLNRKYQIYKELETVVLKGNL